MKLISRLGSVIEVRQSWTGNKLYIDGYPQSQSTYRRDWKTILRKAGVARQAGQPNILLLGMGGGDVIKLLQKINSEASITAVEVETEVVAVAKKYFGVDVAPNLQIIIADAEKHMQTNRVKYDLVVVDLYSGDKVPTFVTTAKFLQNVARSVSAGGKAIFNYASHSFTQKDFTEFEQKLHQQFERVAQLKTWGHTYYLVSL